MLALSAVVALSLVATLKLTSAQTSSPQLLLQGRFGSDNEQSYADSLPVLFSWPSSSVFVTFDSSEIYATLSAVAPTTSVSGYNRFTFSVDQVQQAVLSQDLDNTVINWNMSGLSTGSHNLTITKLNEASYGEATLDALTLGTGGQ